MALASSLAIVLYIASSFLLARRFTMRTQPPVKYSDPIILITLFALLFHGVDIFLTMKNAGGWDLSIFSTLIIASWLMALFALLIGLRTPIAHPGILIYPIVAISLFFKTTLPNQYIATSIPPALEWHILLSLTAYSLFTLAAIQAIVLAIQEQLLRQHHPAGLMRKLPPLQTMENWLFKLISSGFIILSLGLFSGFFFLEDLFGQHLVHKTVLSLVAWVVFAVLLRGRKKFGWRGKKAVRWTLTGFSFLVLAYFGSKFVLEFLLERV